MALVDGLGNPTCISLGEGNGHDMRYAPDLVKGLESTTLVGDKGFDADHFVAQLVEQGCSVVIPARSNRKSPRDYDTATYRHRYLVEVFFQKIKRNRRVATRYEKLAATFIGMVQLASILVWLR